MWEWTNLWAVKLYLCGWWTSRIPSSAPLPAAAAQSHRAAQRPRSCRNCWTESHAVFLPRSARAAPPTQASLNPGCRSLCLAGGRAAAGGWRTDRWMWCGSRQSGRHSSQCDGTAKAAAGRSPALWGSVPLRKPHGGRRWWPKMGSLGFLEKGS